MKTSKKAQQSQRKLIERKLRPWLPLRSDQAPPAGWLKAIRGALGINTRQLAARLGMDHAAIIQFEKREAQGKVSLESIQKVARAMRCQLIYAVVPHDSYDSLDSILDDQALQAARTVISRVDHTMRLEQQGLSAERSNEQIRDLAARLKADMAPSLWGEPKTVSSRKKAK